MMLITSTDTGMRYQGRGWWGGGGWRGEMRAQLHLPVHTAETPDPGAALSELRTLVTWKLTTSEQAIDHAISTR